MRVVKGVALGQAAFALALAVLAIATTDWRPFAMAALMAYGATLLWKDATVLRRTLPARPGRWRC